jgi:hypothetical protein
MLLVGVGRGRQVFVSAYKHFVDGIYITTTALHFIIESSHASVLCFIHYL